MLSGIPSANSFYLVTLMNFKLSEYHDFKKAVGINGVNVMYIFELQ
jgi:hypothetical protein